MKSVNNVISVLKNFTESISRSMRDQTKALEEANALKVKEKLEMVEAKDKSGAWREVKNPKESEIYPLVKTEPDKVSHGKKINKLWTF